MNLVSYALVSLDSAKTFLGISTTAHDEVLKYLINQATDYIESVTGRRYASTVYTNEEYDGTGSVELRLKHHPVVTFTSLQVNNAVDNTDSWEMISATDYWVDLETGIITRTSDFLAFDASMNEGLSPNIFTKGKNRYRATYTAGYATIPYDLQYACMMFVSEAFNKRKAAGIQSESLGDHSITFASISSSDNTVKEVLAGYRDYEI